MKKYRELMCACLVISFTLLSCNSSISKEEYLKIVDEEKEKIGLYDNVTINLSYVRYPENKKVDIHKIDVKEEIKIVNKIVYIKNIEETVERYVYTEEIFEIRDDVEYNLYWIKTDSYNKSESGMKINYSIDWVPFGGFLREYDDFNVERFFLFDFIGGNMYRGYMYALLKLINFDDSSLYESNSLTNNNFNVDLYEMCQITGYGQFVTEDYMTQNKDRLMLSTAEIASISIENNKLSRFYYDGDIFYRGSPLMPATLFQNSFEIHFSNYGSTRFMDPRPADIIDFYKNIV